MTTKLKQRWISRHTSYCHQQLYLWVWTLYTPSWINKLCTCWFGNSTFPPVASLHCRQSYAQLNRSRPVRVEKHLSSKRIQFRGPNLYSFVTSKKGMSAIVVEQQLMLCRGVKQPDKLANAILIVYLLSTGYKKALFFVYDGRGNVLSTKFKMKPRWRANHLETRERNYTQEVGVNEITGLDHGDVGSIKQQRLRFHSKFTNRRQQSPGMLFFHLWWLHFSQ